MAKTISTSTYATSGFTLTSAASPLSITSTGSIGRTAATGGHAAIYGAGGASTNWTITNSGHVSATGTGLFGINLGYFGPTVTSALIINNSGGLIAGQQYGIITDGATTITNQSGGTLSANGNDIVFLQTKGTIFNYGLAINTNATGLYLQGGGVVVNGATGTISIDTAVSGIGVRLNAVGTVTNAGTIIGGTGGAVGFEATTSANRLIVVPGAVFQGGINGGTGLLELTSAASAGVLGTFSTSGITNFGTLTFDAGSTWTIKGNATTVTTGGFGSISMVGFANTDTIDLLNFSFAGASETFASNAMVLTNSAAQHATLHMQGTFSTSDFHIASYAGGSGITITDTTPCYLAGTRIRTDRGEIMVEDLSIGDRVITLSGEAKPIKWIGRRAYASAFAAGNRDVIPILIKEGALGKNVPANDLYVSPLHAMFFDDVLIQAEHLVNGVSIVRCPEIDPIQYFHVELDQHDVIFAEGAPAETFVDCDSRGMFHNAREFGQLYPADAPAKWQFCAPRIESGPILEQVRHGIAVRAGLQKPDGSLSIGPLHGNLDGVEGASIVGWAFDPANPDRPVTLEVLDGDGLIARVTANRFRGDLEAAGIGDGRHGFELRLARSLSPMARHEIRLRRVSDGRELPGSPLVIEPHSDGALLKDASVALDTAIGVASDDVALEAILTTLLDRMGQVRRLHTSFRPLPRRDDRLVSWAKGTHTRPKRALVIDDRIPMRDRDAGSNAVLGHIDALQALGWEVEFVASHELARADEAAAAMRAMGVRCHQAPQVASVEEVLRRNRNSYDLVYLHRLSNAETYATMVRAWQARARVLYSVADLHHVRIGRQAAIQANAEQAEQSLRLKARELAAMRLADAVITHSPDEAAYLAREAPGALVHVVPWALVPRRRAIPLRHREEIAFIGGYRHAPNADAVRWLSDAVMPLVWAQDPDIACRIVGPDWPDSFAASMDPRMRFMGHVPRLDDVFDAVRLTVAPLRFGAGLKGKVLDSLSAGLPCAMTSVAAEGLPLTRQLRGLVADTPEALAELICDLYHRSGVNRSRAAAGLSMIDRFYTEDIVRVAMAKALGTEPAESSDRVLEPEIERLPPVVIWDRPKKRVAARGRR